MAKATTKQAHINRATKPRTLTLADVTISWKDEAHFGGRERTITGPEIVDLIRRSLFLGHTAPGETPLWQCRIRGLSALMYPEAGISVHDEDGRSLVASLLDNAAAGIALEGMDLTALARQFRITPRRS